MNALAALKKEARTALVDKISSFPVTSMEVIDQTNELLIGTLQNKSEMQLNALVGLDFKMLSYTNMAILISYNLPFCSIYALAKWHIYILITNFDI